MANNVDNAQSNEQSQPDNSDQGGFNPNWFKKYQKPKPGEKYVRKSQHARKCKG